MNLNFMACYIIEIITHNESMTEITIHFLFLKELFGGFFLHIVQLNMYYFLNRSIFRRGRILTCTTTPGQSVSGSNDRVIHTLNLHFLHEYFLN